MEAMFHTPRERKSKSLDKIKKENKERKKERGRDMWQGGRWEEISHLNQVGSDSVGEKEKNEEEKKKKKKRKNKESGVRSSTFSLRSTEIRPSVFVRGRGKVHLRDESFA